MPNIDEVLRAHGIGVGKRLVGNAQPGDVRSGKTFSNADGNDKVGSLAVQATTTQTITPGTSDVVKAAGIYDGAITILGDPDLITGNIKSGVNIFGVAGKTEVVDTVEATSPASASQIRSGRIAFVNGAKVTGSLTVQATSAQTVTPGTADIVKAAGIYDGAITISGDADLVTGNIKSGVNIFGVAGKAEVVDTVEATSPAAASQIRSGRIAFVNGAKVTGTLAVQSTTAQTVTPGTANIIKSAGIYDGDITISGDADLVTGNIKSGVNIFGVAGKTEVVDTTEATTPVVAGDVISGHIAFVNGVKVTGTMANNGATGGTISSSGGTYTIPAGYTSGGTVTAFTVAAANIKYNAVVGGVTGTYDAEPTNPAAAGDVISGHIAFVNGVKVTGTMANNGATGGTISSSGGTYTIPAGYTSGGTVTAFTVAAANVKSGAVVGGVTGTYDTEATSPAGAANILSGKIAFVNGAKVTGTMANNGATTATLATNGATYAVPAGYTPGGTITASITNLVAANIKYNAVVGGVTGTYDAEPTNPAAASQIRSGKIAFVNGAKVTGTLTVQSTVAQTVTPGTTDVVKGAGIYDGAITIKGDANLLTGNILAGKTIFGVAGKSQVVDTTNTVNSITGTDVLSGHVGFVNGAKVTGTMNDFTGIEVAPNDYAALGIYEGSLVYNIAAASEMPNWGYIGDGSDIYIDIPNMVTSNIKKGVIVGEGCGASITGTFGDNIDYSQFGLNSPFPFLTLFEASNVMCVDWANRYLYVVNGQNLGTGYVKKYGFDGTVIWTTNWSISSYGQASCAAVYRDTLYVATGSGQILKFTSTGVLSNIASFGQCVYSMIIASDGTVYLGYYNSSYGYMNKYPPDASGNPKFTGAVWGIQETNGQYPLKAVLMESQNALYYIASTGYSYGMLVRADTATGSKVYMQYVNAAYNTYTNTYYIAVDNTNKFVYVGTNLKLIKFNHDFSTRYWEIAYSPGSGTYLSTMNQIAATIDGNLIVEQLINELFINGATGATLSTWKVCVSNNTASDPSNVLISANPADSNEFLLFRKFTNSSVAVTGIINVCKRKISLI